MADQATLEAWLEEAEAALHAVLIGKRAVRLQHGDTSTQFNETNVSDLRAYIAELRAQLSLTTGRVRARRVVFG
jgi:hypothetical protein